MEEENKVKEERGIRVSKKTFAWYTLFSFLFVTLMIFIAVMATDSAAENRVGGTYAKQLALALSGAKQSEVSELTSEKSYKDGKEVFKVTYIKDGEKKVYYIDAEDATLKDDTKEEAENN